MTVSFSRTLLALCSLSLPLWGVSLALHRVPVSVPAGLRSTPFNQDRFLNVPPNYDAAVYARVPGARFLALAPNGDLLVSQPGAGRITLLRPNGNAGPQSYVFAQNLRLPHDMVFHVMDGTTWLYVSESHQVSRYRYNLGDVAAREQQVVVTGLPDSSLPELRGAYGHELKNIALDSQHRLYVSIGSTCNVCTSDTTSNPVRGAIYRYDADGRNGRLFARGLRNAEGLAFAPGTSDLWVVVNQRDNIPYPARDATGQYGQVLPSYVDSHPPEAFTRVRDGGNYGWPFCHPNPDAGVKNMPFDADAEMNRSGQVDCNTMDRIAKGIQAHSAPLGLLFLPASAPSAYRGGAITALHGSWNRTTKTGYKVIYFPWREGEPGQQADFVTGWLDSQTLTEWGRPVDVAADAEGGLYISDDASGTVYKLTYHAPLLQPVRRR